MALQTKGTRLGVQMTMALDLHGISRASFDLIVANSGGANAIANNA